PAARKMYPTARIGGSSDTLVNRRILQAKRVPVPMKRQIASVTGVGFAGLIVVAVTCVCHMAAAATTKSDPFPAAVLVDAMESELHRAMSSLGNTATDNTQQPKPYFLSYAVSDSDSIAISAQFGAIVGSNESRRRIADVQVRLGTAAEDNTHGDHRNS